MANRLTPAIILLYKRPKKPFFPSSLKKEPVTIRQDYERDLLPLIPVDCRPQLLQPVRLAVSFWIKANRTGRKLSGQSPKGGSEEIDSSNSSAACICSVAPLTAKNRAPSAPQTPPPPTSSAVAPVSSRIASISVNTCPGTGNKRGPCAPGVFNRTAKFVRSAMVRFSNPTGRISRTRRPATACNAEPIVPALGSPIHIAACPRDRSRAFAPFNTMSPSFRPSTTSKIVFPFCHNPLTMTTSPGNLVSSGSRPVSVVGREGGSVIPRKNRFRAKSSTCLMHVRTSSATYPFVVPATITTVPDLRASNIAGCTANALPINRLPHAGVITNCFIEFSSSKGSPLFSSGFHQEIHFK